MLWAYLAAGILSVTGAEPSVSYEESLIRWGLTQSHGQVEPAPEGLEVEAVRVAAEEVVAESDPYPSLLNWFHWRTRDEVIRREILVEVGTPYQQVLVAETARNLRKLFLFSVVRLVPIKGTQPGKVQLLVVTKDLWSLRTNIEFAAVGTLIQLLRVQPIEQNFLGLNQQVGLDFILSLGSLSLGQVFQNRRLLGTRLALAESAFMVVGRESGKVEGSRGALSVSRPLFSLDTRWGFETLGTWHVQRTRIFRGARVWQLPGPEGAVPYLYERNTATLSAMGLRSFGALWKTNVAAGLGAHHREYRPPSGDSLSEVSREWLRTNYLPFSEDAAYLLASVRFFEARFAALQGVESFALSEDYALGPSVLAVGRYAPKVFDRASHFAEAGVTARYRWLWHEALTTVSAAASARRTLSGEGGWTNRRWAVELAQVSPRLLQGRFVVRGFVDVNVDDVLERVNLLGGGNGLRGAPADAYAGKRVALLNVEYRTRPWVVRTVHVGGVLFYDVGSAFDLKPIWAQSVGVGLRFLLPQFNVTVFRLDFGYALTGDRPPIGGRFAFTAGQNTEFRPEILDTPLR